MRIKRNLLYVSLALALMFGATTVWGGSVYYVQPGDSLHSIANRFGTTVSALQQSNALRTSAITPGQALRITTGASQTQSTGSMYTVRPGDTLFLLGKRFGVSPEQIRQTNRLNSTQLVVGARLKIPAQNTTSGNVHHVKKGDTLYLVARRYGVSVEALKQANGIKSDSLAPGRTLSIPTQKPKENGMTYSVRNGDTLFLIAKRNGISVDALVKANQLASRAGIYPGQVLKIPWTVSSEGLGQNLSRSDIELFARLVTAEAGGESYIGQVAVAATILNRLRDPRYPKTIPGIVYQIEQGRYQYSPVLDGRINQPASSQAYRAVQAALSGWDPSGGANGFFNPAKTRSKWVRSNPQTTVIGNHVFFRY